MLGSEHALNTGTPSKDVTLRSVYVMAAGLKHLSREQLCFMCVILAWQNLLNTTTPMSPGCCRHRGVNERGYTFKVLFSYS